MHCRNAHFSFYKNAQLKIYGTLFSPAVLSAELSGFLVFLNGSLNLLSVNQHSVLSEAII